MHVVLLLIRTGGAGAGDDWQVGGLLIFVVRTRAHHTYLKKWARELCGEHEGFYLLGVFLRNPGERIEGSMNVSKDGIGRVLYYS